MRGLTGGIASGKSTVAKILEELGAIVLDADKIAKELMEPQQPGWTGVTEEFPEVINTDQSINRQLLGRIIFNNLEKRKKLEAIIHPLVISEIKRLGDKFEADNQVVFADIPLLYEIEAQAWLDEVWLVYIPYEIQLARLMLRDNLDKHQAKLRIEAQMPLDEKRLLADQIIDNSGSFSETRAQVGKLWNTLTGHENIVL